MPGMAVLRLNTDGTLDSNFGTSGVAIVGPGGGAAYSVAVAWCSVWRS